MLVQFFILVLAGFLLGGFGTLIGAGGGFLLVPALALWHSEEPAERITALSLLVVFANATSGTIAYARRGLVHVRSGLVFAASAVPGAIAGTFISPHIPRGTFDVALGCFLVGMSVLLVWRTLHKPPAAHEGWTGPTARQMLLGALVSTLVGLISSLLGIGGGIIHVPLLAYMFAYPVHRATATSHFVLAITAGIASGVNIYDGRLDGNWMIVLPLAIGVVVGAQVGAAVSRRVKPRAIILALCGAIVLVGGRLVFRAMR